MIMLEIHSGLYDSEYIAYYIVFTDFAGTPLMWEHLYCNGGLMPKRIQGTAKQYGFDPRMWTPLDESAGHQFIYKKFHDYVRGGSLYVDEVYI